MAVPRETEGIAAIRANDQPSARQPTPHRPMRAQGAAGVAVDSASQRASGGEAAR
jgi:hypothetical protein